MENSLESSAQALKLRTYCQRQDQRVSNMIGEEGGDIGSLEIERLGSSGELRDHKQ